MALRDFVRSSLISTASATSLDRLVLGYRRRQNTGRCGLVIGMHETPVSLRHQLQRQLEWVSRQYTIVGLEEFAKLWDDPVNHRGNCKPPVLFSFDDGRESNYTVAAPMLESFGARGVFFVVPAFADCPPERALEFYRSRINPTSRAGAESWEDWRPMSPAQIADLSKRGHAIGNHTFSHARLIGLGPNELQHEVVDSAARLSEWTGKPTDAFAWTFAWDSVDRAAWDLIRQHHRFCFAACPGAVDARTDSRHLIWRREIEARYSPAEYRFQYSGLADMAWSSRRRQLVELLTDQK